jgi:hypothetical protein
VAEKYEVSTTLAINEFPVLPETTKRYLPIARAEHMVPLHVIEDTTKHLDTVRRKCCRVKKSVRSLLLAVFYP